MKSEAKPDKTIIPREKFRDLESWKYSLDFPPQFSIETTNYCNLYCTFCPVNTPQMTRKRGHMSMDLVKRVIEESLEHGKRHIIGLSSAGDPLLNPRIVDIIKYIEKAGATTEIRLSTNAVALTREISKELVKLDSLSIVASVNATNSDDYKKMTGLDCFDLVENNIQTFLDERNKVGKSWPKLVLRMTRLHDTTLDERFIDKWKHLGDGVSVVEAWSWLGTVKAKKVIHPILQFPCHLLWSHMVINWDGTVPLCAQDLLGRMIIGNLKDQTMQEVWTSDRLNQIRKLHLERKMNQNPLCAKCDSIHDRKYSNEYIPFLEQTYNVELEDVRKPEERIIRRGEK